MKPKLSVGSWAYCFGPYSSKPIDFETVVRRLAQLRFDGVEICGFRPHIHADDYESPAKVKKLKDLLAKYKLSPSGYAPDFTQVPPTTEAALKNDAYLRTFEKNLNLCVALGIPSIRVDCVSPPTLPPGVDHATAWKRVVGLWQKCAELAAQARVKLVWEFEPGFCFNKPSEIVRLVADVGHPNFSVLFDTCHAHMVSVVAARQPEPKETLKGGAVELAGLLKGRIGHIHLIDSDNTLHDNETSTHAPFGTGVLDFDKLIPAILDAGYDGEWWTVDLCFWPHAWEVTEAAKGFLARFVEKYGEK